MDPSSNFSSYRSTLKAAMWRSAGATDQRQRIVIPFFSLLVKDLYFLNQGCSNRSVKQTGILVTKQIKLNVKKKVPQDTVLEPIQKDVC